MARSFVVAVVCGTAIAALSQPAAPAAPAAQVTTLLTLSGKVEVSPPGKAEWSPAQTNQTLQVGERIRTGKSSRATLRLSNLSILRVYELTTLEIQAPQKPGASALLDVQSGAAYFFNRDRPLDTQFRTPSASGAIRGTEFNLTVADDGTMKLALLDGQVDLNNGQGSVQLKSGEQAVAEKGGAPRKSPLLDAVNVIQWTLYYPAILDLDELNLEPGVKEALAGSLEAYRAGDLLQALSQYPESRAPASDSERVYRAALLLADGQVGAARPRQPRGRLGRRIEGDDRRRQRRAVQPRGGAHAGHGVDGGLLRGPSAPRPGAGLGNGGQSRGPVAQQRFRAGTAGRDGIQFRAHGGGAGRVENEP
jgi:hypothetical protein